MPTIDNRPLAASPLRSATRWSAVLAAGTLALLLAAGSVRAQELLHHQMTLVLDPESHSLQVSDRIQLPVDRAAGPVEFLLNSTLAITASEPAVVAVPLGEAWDFHGINGSSDVGEGVELTRYRLESVPGDGVVLLSWGGSFDFGLSDAKEEYTRGFRSTAGIVGGEGVYLSASGFWYPTFSDALIRFTLEAEAPEDWHLISQGSGTSRDAQGKAAWKADSPMEEIYVVGGPLVRYSDAAGAVEALVYLHEADDALAAKYLTTTAQYLEMYRELIGAYPYGKFALVENFWETGYGMPTFTLLGPSIIRFPFILHSSYPHEILHNWWGNSVFPDYPTGNWCEGLTAYMADHLVQEQRGKGADYRRSTLQKYRDYVKEGRDFPLSEFRSRHSAATEAVGYGKTLMGFHMLRRQLGDDDFRLGLARLYRGYRGKRASFDDIRTVFEGVSEENLESFFDSWVERAGAATLTVDEPVVEATAEGYRVRASLRQTQGGEPFPLEVPVVIQTAAGVVESVVSLTADEATFELTTTDQPLTLRVDPDFDTFRKLDPRETPPSIGQLFGEPEILALLPAGAGAAEIDGYRELMTGWQSDSHLIELATDAEVPELPADRPVWILGRNNRHAAALFPSAPEKGFEFGGDGASFDGESAAFAEHSFIVTRRHPENLGKAIGWLIVDPPAALPGMGRKLPHYGKYSYLAFEGDEPSNVIKGQWPTSDSPLTVDLRPADDRAASPPSYTAAKRSALAELPPVFSQQELMAHVDYLASPELEGRGVGTAGLDLAADYIEEKFRQYGLLPGGDDGGYRQRFTVPSGPDGEPHEVANVIGYIAGSNAAWSEQSAIVSAHYDHLGFGWPDVRQGNENTLHAGADDNASGVAVMLELAKNLAAGEPPLRNLVFVAFTAEESGLLGSKQFVEHPLPFPLAGLRGVINIDTVGQLEDQKVSVLGTGTTTEWQHIFRGASFVTGVESRNVAEAAGGSDQMSFINQGIPGVQIFTQAHADYHAPGDTSDKVDGVGLVKICGFVKEAVAYLGAREEPLTVTIATQDEPANNQPAAAPSSGRRVRFGTVPEFAFAGPGVQVAAVVPDSPAEKAGVRGGDLLIRLAGQEVANLQAYSDLLRTLEPGQTVQCTVLRDGSEVELSATLETR